jgi:hypothetical protein
MRLQRFVIQGLAVVASLSMAGAAAAQPMGSPVEIGAQFSTLRLGEHGTTNAGFGARASYDLAQWMSIEGEFNFFPSDRFEVDASALSLPGFTVRYNRQRLQAFFGPKAGFRGRRFGAFVKLRPGFARLTDKGLRCVGEPCALILLARPVYRTELALDAGAVLEFYPSARTVARLDLGTTAIRHRSQAPPCRDCTSRNFSSGLGLGFRF